MTQYMEKLVVEMEIGTRGQMNVENEKYYGMCEKCCDAGRGNIALLRYVDVLQGVAQGCTLAPNLIKVYRNSMIVAVTKSQGEGRYGVGIDTCG